MYPRLINILKNKSFLLFGARGTGKSSLLKSIFGKEALLWVDLLSDRDFVRFNRDPGLIYDQVHSLFQDSTNQESWVVVDEVQRVPQLLNEVHRLLEADWSGGRLFFALTGSSARKLKRGGANLLAGRALVNNLYPLTYRELGRDFDLTTVLNWGSLPAILSESDLLVRSEMLESYTATYLREEIREEQIVRRLDPFTRFLEVAAQTSGQIVNYAAVARDCQVDPKSVARFFQILEDTLLGVNLPCFHRSVRQQQSKSPRFYLFDLGVQRSLRGAIGVPVTPQSYGYGQLFEHFVIIEIIRLNSYLRKRWKLSYLRTKDNAEIDLIIERPAEATILLEIKSSALATSYHARHLESFLPDFPEAQAWLVSQDEKNRKEGNIDMLHWRTALDKLFDY